MTGLTRGHYTREAAKKGTMHKTAKLLRYAPKRGAL